MRRTIRRVALGAVAASALVPVAPAAAIVGGQPDTVHKNVGLVRFSTEDGRFRCSGTLIADNVVLTAGHCTEGPATDVYVTFDDKLVADPMRDPSVANRYLKGTAHPDPGWDGQLNFAKQHDQGVVVLNGSAKKKWGIEPAPLPPVGYMDRNQGQLKKLTYTLVGYGVNIVGPRGEQEIIQERRSTTSMLQNVGSEVLTFQINSKDANAGGGSCFGDSGGGVFLDGYVLGDASYVNSLKCNGQGSYQRDDTSYSRAFLNAFIK
jgi:hypothetical protein